FSIGHRRLRDLHSFPTRRSSDLAGTWLGAGGTAGDRVIVMALNSSEFVRSWWGAAVGNFVQVPINTNYEGEFLRHQLSVVDARLDRKSTRLNSSHVSISYAVFCL